MQQLKRGTNVFSSVVKKKVDAAVVSVSSTKTFPMVGLTLQLEVPTMMISIPGSKVGEECCNSDLDDWLEVVAANIHLEAVTASIHLEVAVAITFLNFKPSDCILTVIVNHRINQILKFRFEFNSKCKAQICL
jgi:hypothetical protein